MKNKTSAALLAIFLGGFGAHKFYLGKTGQGILYLLFFWTLVPAIIAFVEFIIFLTMDDTTFNLKYNNGQGVAVAGAADELEKLYSLKEKGIITAEEFEARKRRLL